MTNVNPEDYHIQIALHQAIKIKTAQYEKLGKLVFKAKLPVVNPGQWAKTLAKDILSSNGVAPETLVPKPVDVVSEERPRARMPQIEMSMVGS